MAGRLADRFHRPVVMISWDKAGMRPGIGSARSVPGFDLQQRGKQRAGRQLGDDGRREKRVQDDLERVDDDLRMKITALLAK